MPIGLAQLWDALAQRRTYRHAFSEHALAEPQQLALTEVATQEQAWLQPLRSDSTRHAIAEPPG